ncbi:Internalin-I [Candida viswanathii]|uniref:Internalin-I n=1 Tax=Candida viswanathii TaxID=5486 RepID=A0A367YJR3_9ASCO|nr:Internalin-I [Candida viswanathii]
MTCAGFLRLCESHPNLTPKKLIFTNAHDALKVARKSLLKLPKRDTVVEVVFPTHKRNANERFSLEYAEMGIRVDSVVFEHTADFDYYDIFSMKGTASSFSMQTILGTKLGDSFDELFPDITSLSINEPLKVTDLKLLPRKLRKLDCRVQLIRELTMLQLPQRLEDLSIAIGRASFEVPTVIISHLSRIRKLDLRTKDHNTCTKWSLPLGTRVLHVAHYDMIGSQKLFIVCPELIELKIHDHKGPFKDFVARALGIPKTLRRLQLPSDMLAFGPKSSRPELKLSYFKLLQISKLTELSFTSNIYDARRMALAFVPGNFNHLHTLSIVDVKNVVIFGDYPSGLRKLVYRKMNIPLPDLSGLQYLTEVELDSLKSIDEYTGCFSRSLRKLTISGCGFKKVNIDAPELDSLTLSSNNFTVLNEETFVIPSSVRVLDVHMNYISTVSVKFPDGLEELNLSFNRITTIGTLPKNLKVLNIARNNLGSSDQVTHFPTSLTRLDVSWNELTNSWLEKQNLAQYTTLSDLSIAHNKLPSLNLDLLPSSVVLLSLSFNETSSFIGTFKRFEKLQSLDLACNRLQGYFLSLGDSCVGEFFGSDIAVLDIYLSRLTSDDAEVLSEHLRKRSRFLDLDAGSDVLPNLEDLPVFRPKKAKTASYRR